MSSRRSQPPARAAGAPPGQRDVFTVSRLNEAARALLEDRFGTVWVEGEISNLARPASGHIYFSLKDPNAQLRCAMFRSRNTRLGFEPRNGLAVLAHGRVSLYTARGEFQLVVDALEPAGEGLLRLRFEQLKRKLEAEGLFDTDTKRPLPGWPRAIGVVTSPSGAAVRDILQVLARRCPSIPVILYPTAVQGETAAPQIAAAIARADRRAECDVLIVGRGGGSLEDLWAFNEEAVARAIAHCSLPVVSAVGHEVDFTIADLVADVRAPTPSAAAELVSPEVSEIRRGLATLTRRLRSTTGVLLRGHHRELRHLTRRLVSPRRLLETRYQRVDELSQRLPAALRNRLALANGRVGTVAARLAAHSPAARIRQADRDLEHRQTRLAAALRAAMVARSERLARLTGLLRALGPAPTLERGYAIVTDEHGAVVRDASEIKADQRLRTRLARGAFESTVTKREEF